MERILIVEDEKNIREVLARALQDKGFYIETVETGEQALQVIQKQEVILNT